MAQFARSPGDTTTLYESDIRYSNTGGTIRNTSNASAIDKRPSYAYGQILPLPGGRTFRKATTYQHSNYECVITSPYIGAGQFSSGYKYVTDYGRESNLFINNVAYTKSLFGGGFHPQSDDLSNEVITKALLKIADNKAGIGEDLLTFRQTLGLFIGKGNILLNLLKMSGSKKDWQKFLRYSSRELRARGPLNSAAQAYLEFVYGLKPLVADIYGTAEVLKKLGVLAMLIDGRGKGARDVSDDTVSSYTNYSYTRVRRLSGSGSAKATCHLWARIDPAHQGLRALSQLGLVNPLSLAWEVVPWSFVVDWFVPVGPVLQALSAPAGLIFVDGSIATKAEQSVQYQFQTASTYWNPGDAASKGYVTSEGASTVSSEGYNRTHLTNWPRPGIFTISDPFAGDRPLKALALGILALNRYTHNV